MDYLERSSFTDTYGLWTVHVHVTGRLYWRLSPSTRHRGVRIVSNIEPKHLVKSPAWRPMHSVAMGDDQSGYQKARVQGQFSPVELHTADGKTVITVDHATTRATYAIDPGDMSYPKDMRNTDVETVYAQRLMYWAQMQMFPSHIQLHPACVQAATNALLWCQADRVLFTSSNAPFSKEASSEMLSLLRDISKEAQDHNIGISLETWYVAAVLRHTTLHRIKYHYGRVDAQKYRERARNNELPENLPMISSVPVRMIWHILSWILLTSPYGYLSRIATVDRTQMGDGISTIRWVRLISALCREWNSSNLLSTVLISATVAVLAIPGINGVAAVLAILSILCAIFSVCSGLFMLWIHQSLTDTDSVFALVYFAKAKALTGSSHLLAIGLSLPLVSTLYGMLLFLGSIASYSLDSHLAHDFAIVMRVATIAVLIALLVLACTVIPVFSDKFIDLMRLHLPSISHGAVVDAVEEEEGSQIVNGDAPTALWV
ncbi:hypothetical protein PUNSTDRAFT_134186 [Punctularia strigosozonata HHB-11173 SS5]|uniref:uncharacterized protein n=1 Tax=Punctularia strigosozonata (strain HHB-11173) TaxID=741275 RepID=UPI0004416A67|nr:uncharacterized protein PUNSTDRAFT_134186 [Punctularia strigosozonata HHB-11173 SS5]EIN09013.1 hypothetical protein PUNSTDRAFT_134186 [Punctularia strigosozonata HHB-11173 SS5]